MRIRSISSLFFILILIYLALILSACSDENGNQITDPGTVVPPGTDLTGIWTTNDLTISAGGNTATFTIEFTVIQDSPGVQIATEFYLVGISSKQSLEGSAEIKDGRFNYTKDFSEITCNDIPARLIFKGAFRTDSTADGDWSDLNLPPPGYIFCGTAKGKWQATRTPFPAFAEFLTHNTGSLKVSVFDNGNIGHLQTQSTGDGVRFNDGPDAMYSSGIIFGTTSRGSVNGQIGSYGVDYDLIRVAGFSGFYPLSPNWSQVTDVSYFDAIAPNPYYLDIFQTSYSDNTEDYMFLRYRLSSYILTSNDLYVGIFADWDVGVEGYDVNLGGIDLSRNLVYQFQAEGIEDGNYYGIIALNGVSGVKLAAQGEHSTIRDSAFTWISTIDSEISITPQDYRTFIGSGPFSISALDSVIVDFCIVCGSNITDLLLNADGAIQKYNNVLKK